MDLTRIYKRTYRNQKLRIDGHRFVECRFERCLLEYGAIDEVSFINCSLVDVDWSFVGSAANTINFLSSLYNGFGPKGQFVVEDLFNSIRAGEPGQTDPVVLEAIGGAIHRVATAP